jgi:DNA-directed RNA polymerase specialized sigma24 family protein
VVRAEPTSRKVHILWVCWLLGWTQEEIGEVVGLSQRKVGQKLEDFLNLLKLLKSLLDRGDSVLGGALMWHMD